MSLLDLEKQNLMDFEEVIKRPAGARLIAGIIDFCGVFRDDSDDAARKVGLMLYRMALNVNQGELCYINGRNDCREILLKQNNDNDKEEIV